MSMENKKKDYREYLKVPIRSDRKPLQELLPLDQPLRILIDPCDICNFRCVFCFQCKEDFKGSKMTSEIFDIVVEQLKEFDRPINVVHMYGLGEPLLNEHLPEYIAKLKEKHVAKEVAVTTNGSLLNKELSKKLVNAGLDRLSISLNGIETDHFRKIVGVDVDFERIYEQIQYFYSIREACHLHVKINGEYFSEEDKEKFVFLFKDCADSINIDHVVNVWPGLEITENDTQNMYDYWQGDLNQKKAGKKLVCPLMFYEMLIHSDGSISPCCVDYGFKKQNLGNILQDTIRNIWQGEKLLRMHRQALRGEKIEYKICEGCSYMECAATVDITPYRDELVNKY